MAINLARCVSEVRAPWEFTAEVKTLPLTRKLQRTTNTSGHYCNILFLKTPCCHLMFHRADRQTDGTSGWKSCCVTFCTVKSESHHDLVVEEKRAHVFFTSSLEITRDVKAATTDDDTWERPACCSPAVRCSSARHLSPSVAEGLQTFPLFCAKQCYSDLVSVFWITHHLVSVIWNLLVLVWF